MVNSNIIKMYNAQGHFEGVLNSIGDRQNELIRSNVRMLEWFTSRYQEIAQVKDPNPYSLIILHPMLGINMS